MMASLVQFLIKIIIHQGGVVMSSQIKHTHSQQDTPLSREVNSNSVHRGVYKNYNNYY